MPPQNIIGRIFLHLHRIDSTNKLNADLDAVELMSPKQVLVQPNSALIHLQQGGNSFFLTTFVLQHWFIPSLPTMLKIQQIKTAKITVLCKRTKTHKDTSTTFVT
jgi:hypothetical protein